MVVASGFMEVNSTDDIKAVTDELASRQVEVDTVENDKIVFLIERDSLGDAKAAFEQLKYIDGVRNVYLAYYSLDGADENVAAEDGSELTH
ncbi:MAG: chaperone NapD [Dissulfurispiraceae bacterium]|jgi:nitrate reductase NapAB chaperone NapD|nr:chaperone NapD [Dissulfurispiraceae bacterium]